MSGLNRHAKQQEVLHDPKNRLVIAYMRLIEYLQPSFIFMEQVAGLEVGCMLCRAGTGRAWISSHWDCNIIQ